MKDLTGLKKHIEKAQEAQHEFVAEFRVLFPMGEFEGNECSSPEEYALIQTATDDADRVMFEQCTIPELVACYGKLVEWSEILE